MTLLNDEKLIDVPMKTVEEKKTVLGMFNRKVMKADLGRTAKITDEEMQRIAENEETERVHQTAKELTSPDLVEYYNAHYQKDHPTNDKAIDRILPLYINVSGTKQAEEDNGKLLEAYTGNEKNHNAFVKKVCDDLIKADSSVWILPKNLKDMEKIVKKYGENKRLYDIAWGMEDLKNKDLKKIIGEEKAEIFQKKYAMMQNAAKVYKESADLAAKDTYWILAGFDEKEKDHLHDLHKVVYDSNLNWLKSDAYNEVTRKDIGDHLALDLEKRNEIKAAIAMSVSEVLDHQNLSTILNNTYRVFTAKKLHSLFITKTSQAEQLKKKMKAVKEFADTLSTTKKSDGLAFAEYENRLTELQDALRTYTDYKKGKLNGSFADNRFNAAMRLAQIVNRELENCRKVLRDNCIEAEDTVPIVFTSAEEVKAAAKAPQKIAEPVVEEAEGNESAADNNVFQEQQVPNNDAVQEQNPDNNADQEQQNPDDNAVQEQQAPEEKNNDLPNADPVPEIKKIINKAKELEINHEKAIGNLKMLIRKEAAEKRENGLYIQVLKEAVQAKERLYDGIVCKKMYKGYKDDIKTLMVEQRLHADITDPKQNHKLTDELQQKYQVDGKVTDESAKKAIREMNLGPVMKRIIDNVTYRKTKDSNHNQVSNFNEIQTFMEEFACGNLAETIYKERHKQFEKAVSAAANPQPDQPKAPVNVVVLE